jgi:hypothetical protein
MNENRFASISNNPLETRRLNGIRRILINRYINNDNNENNISCNVNKSKVILLLIITIILSLSNYFYNWNNNISIIKDEPRTILSLFDNNIFKVNPPLNEQNKFSQNRNLKEEININQTNNETNKNKIEEFDILSRFTLLKEYEIKRKIFNKLDKNYFNFNWTSYKTTNNSSLFQVGDSSNGEGLFIIKKKSETFSDFIRITMKVHEHSYIDNWIIFALDSNLEELSLNFDEIKNRNTNFIEITGIFLTTLFKGELFDIVDENEPRYGKTKYKLIFSFSKQKPDINNNYTVLIENVENIGNIYVNLNNFSLKVESSLGFNFDIKTKIYDINNYLKEISSKINIYCLITGLTGILYSIGVYSIIYNIKKSENVISVINSDCLLINPVWNTYISLVDINIAMRTNTNFYPFLILILFSVVKFMYFDFYLLALYWKKKRNYVTPGVYVKEKMRFYLVYYIISFCSFMWINIFFNYLCIMVLCIWLWIPHIIFNIKKNNKYSYPFIYILGSTLDKLIYPIYFRAFKENFLKCKVNIILMAIMVLFVIFTIIILYIQAFTNPKFMLPKSFQKNEFNFYKTKQELISIRNDIGLEECVICLTPIFEIEKEENNKMIEMEDKTGKSTSEEDEEKLDVTDASTINLTIPSINNNIEEGNEEKDKIIKDNEDNKDNGDINLLGDNQTNKNKNIFKNIFNIIKILFTENFFSFYKKNISALNGELYMFTPCSHVFHSECLEKWFEFKKECPNCRISMKEYLE